MVVPYQCPAGTHREIRKIGKLENPQEDQKDQEGINHGEIREHEGRGRAPLSFFLIFLIFL